MTDLEKQQQWVQSVCDWIESKGDPYADIPFYFNPDQRRLCWNWMSFLDIIDNMKQRFDQKKILDALSFDVIQKTWRDYQRWYYGEMILHR